MSIRTRFGSLAGIAFALSGLAAFAISQAGPDAGSGGRAVIDFYVAHRTAALTSDYLWGVAFACFLVFGAVLRGRLRVDRQTDAAATVSLSAAAVTTAGAAVYFGFDAALAKTPGRLTPPAAQALNVLALQAYLPFAVGVLTFGLATCVAILRSRTLPRWLGWSIAVIGLLAASPIGIVAVVPLLLWCAIAGTYMFIRSLSHGVSGDDILVMPLTASGATGSPPR
jgi:hypothetical protein